MKLFGFRINAGEIKDVREIEKTLENIEEKKNKIIDLGPLKSQECKKNQG